MNWGYRLTFLFVGFAAMMITLVYKATHTRYELVSKDYYSEELRYQEKIDGMNNANAVGDLILAQTDHIIELTLPAALHQNADSASAWFYCKTNAASDRKLKIVFEEGTAVIYVADFARDNYELKLQLTAGNKPYYYTKPVDLKP